MSEAVGIAPAFDPPRQTTVAAQTAAASDTPAAIRAWASLAESAVGDNVFFHPDFALPAIACFGQGRVRMAIVSSETRLLAVAPFTEARLGLVAPAVRVWSHGYGPLGTPLLDREHIDEAAAGLLDRLSPASSGLAVIVPDLPLDGGVAAALARAARAARRSTAILGRGERAVGVRRGATYESGVSTHRRREYARLMRRLGEGHRVELEAVADRETVLARFDEFLTIEASGWKGEGGTALASDDARAAFARQAVAARAAAGAARIHSLRVDGWAVASLISFVCGGTAFTWKIAYDEAFARFSPGAQVMLAAIEGLLAEPTITRLDSCAGPNHALADPLLSDRMPVGTFVISPVGEGRRYRAGLAAARLEVAAIAAAKRVRARVRTLL